MARVPLQAVPENIAGTRRPKQEDAGTTEDASLTDWRRQWRRIMACSVMYFDGIDSSQHETIRSHLTLLGTRFVPFFDRTVTHVVTNRSPDSDHPQGDVLFKAKQLGMKVWDLDKLVRFLTSLLGHPPTRALDAAQSAKLSQLLRQEKLVGPSDRDFTAKRDDYHYFKNPYVLVWDPSHYNRPTLLKQWAPGTDWPQLHSTPGGVCPFLPDARPGLKRRKENREAESKRPAAEPSPAAEDFMERKKTKHHDHSAGKVGDNSRDQTPTPTNEVLKTNESHMVTTPENKESESSATAANAQTSTTSTVSLPTTNGPIRQPLADRSNFDPSRVRSAKFAEIVASGMQRYSATSATKSTTQSGNGLDASGVMASREVANLQRKVLPPPAAVVPARPKTKKPGFCENCLERFDNFDDHVHTKKHRKYAASTHNFEALDCIVHSLARKPAA